MPEDIGSITSAEMSAIDMNCAYHGLSTLQLMENAGAGVAKAISNRFETGNILIFAGRGNNGGDAFVSARHLKKFDIEIVLLGSSKDIRTEESRLNFEIIKKGNFSIREIRDSTELNGVSTSEKDIIIDAILGTGVRGTIREPESSAIGLINRSEAFVLSVDIPSGLDPDRASSSDVRSVHADLTLTFHRMKRGLNSSKAKEFTGVVEVVDIGIPRRMEMIAGPGDVKLLHRRRDDSHKGENGKVLIIGGGPYAGAPALSALAALRTGADWVTVMTPKRSYQAVQSFSPDLIVRPLSSDILSKADLPAITEEIKKHDVVVIGMGLGSEGETVKAAESVIEECEKVVIDADGLYALRLPIKEGTKAIITPHAGEFSKICDLSVPREVEGRVKFAEEFTKANNLTLVLKGKLDVISNGKKSKINITGNSGMTVGGTGDVLSGIIGAMYAMMDDPFQAASAAAFISGKAGDIAFEEYGDSLLATDAIERIPQAISQRN
ncbi:MAG: NAD(P)H-hydrate dehydratase [Halobacteriota archaeon]|nr:NAD(P)H-hydrate dehydratase [Halobacteriota archaeon]